MVKPVTEENELRNRHPFRRPVLETFQKTAANWTTRFSRYIVQSGLLGEVRWVDSSYIQGWLATKVEATGRGF
jgi:hypothetical protein